MIATIQCSHAMCVYSGYLSSEGGVERVRSVDLGKGVWETRDGERTKKRRGSVCVLMDGSRPSVSKRPKNNTKKS